MFIYKIINKINSKVYVGQTKSKRVDIRWSRHRSSLNHNKHHNKHLQAAWNKYGEENFVFEVIEQFNPEMNFDLNNLEKFWIKELDSKNPEKGYNQTLGGDGSSGTKHTEEYKRYMSQKLKGRIRSDEHTARLKQNHASKKLGYVHPMQGRKHRENTIIKLKAYKKTEEHKKSISKTRIENELSRGIKNPMYGKPSPNRKKVYCINNGKEYESQTLAASELGIPTCHISMICSGKLKHSKGFKFEYLKDGK